MTDMKKQKTGAVIVAAGSSERMGGTDKVFSVLDGKLVLARVVEVFQACDRIDDIVIVLNQQNLEEGKRLVAEEGWSKVKGVCEGGERRQDSVLNGLNCVGECDRGLEVAELLDLGEARGLAEAVAGVDRCGNLV